MVYILNIMCVKGQATDVMIHAEEMMRAKKQLIALYSKHTRQPINTIGSHGSDKPLLLQNIVQLFLDVRSIVLVMTNEIYVWDIPFVAGLQCQPFLQVHSTLAQYIPGSQSFLYPCAHRAETSMERDRFMSAEEARAFGLIDHVVASAAAAEHTSPGGSTSWVLRSLRLPI